MNNLRKLTCSTKSVMIGAVLFYALIPALFIWMMSDYPSNYHHSFGMVFSTYLMVGGPYAILGTGLTVLIYAIINWFVAKNLPGLLKAIIVIIIVGFALTGFISSTWYLMGILALGATG